MSETQIERTTKLDLGTIELVLFDIDGVFLAGKEHPRLVSGQGILRALRQRGIPYRLVTNTSTHPRSLLGQQLRGHGLPIDDGDIHAALEVTVGVAARRFPGGKVHVLGEPGMAEVAAAAGITPDLVLDQADDLVDLLL